MSAEKERPPGSARLTFDAGGRGSSIDVNPNWFRAIDDETFTMQWHLTRVINDATEFRASLGNVAPCHLAQLPDGYRFESDPILLSGVVTGWRWTFVREAKTAPLALDLTPAEILYDVFFTYLPRSTPLRRPTVSLRQVLDLDPSLLLPPRKGENFGQSC